MVALVAGALASVVLLDLGLQAYNQWLGPHTPDRVDLNYAALVFIVGVVVAVPFALLVGVPGYYLLRCAGALGIGSVLAIGLIGGGLLHLWLAQLPLYTCAIMGGVAAWVAWSLLPRERVRSVRATMRGLK